jgi:hypothetical protein
MAENCRDISKMTPETANLKFQYFVKSQKLISDYSKKAEISNQDSEPRSAATELLLCVTESFAAHKIFPESQPDLRRLKKKLIFPNFAPDFGDDHRNSRKSPGASG